MTNLTTNRNHVIAARLYALAADARRSALKDGADQALATIHADQARRMRALALRAARNGPLTSERIIMTNLTTNRNHFVASRLYALAAEARRAAIENDIALIERGIVIPPYCRIDTASARYYADQARVMKARAIAVRSNGITG